MVRDWIQFLRTKWRSYRLRCHVGSRYVMVQHFRRFTDAGTRMAHLTAASGETYVLVSLKPGWTPEPYSLVAIYEAYPVLRGWDADKDKFWKVFL